MGEFVRGRTPSFYGEVSQVSKNDLELECSLLGEHPAWAERMQKHASINGEDGRTRMTERGFSKS